MKLSILYRGPLSSCNYDCSYCPFAKQRDPQEVLERDRTQLERFVHWVAEADDEIVILFTPWGEALVRSWYRDAIARLSHLPHVSRVSIQTNLSCGLGWLDGCDHRKVGLWATFHPSATSVHVFADRCTQLDKGGVRYSVGVVGLKEHFDAIEALRRSLHPAAYLWINAYKHEAGYYREADINRLAAIDPLFEINNCRHRSFGRRCRAGESVIAVDGEGHIRRCHFIREPIGNIYTVHWKACLAPRPCTQATCGCHIGYVHMADLDLYSVFGDGVLERIPARPVTRNDARTRLDGFGPQSLVSERVQVSTLGS